MPELPEVETVVRGLRERLMGKTIIGSAAHPECQRRMLKSPYKEMAAVITGQTVQTVLRRGKYILMPLSNSSVLVFHLGMTGRMLLKDVEEGENLRDCWDGQTLSKYYPDHCRLILEFWDPMLEPEDEVWLDGVGLFFCDPRMFGKVWLAQNVRDIEAVDVPGLKGLGYEALDVTFDQFSKLISKGGRSVKSFLLDQTKLAGVGNIYADEACFIANVHPARLTSGLDNAEVAKLWFAVKTVLKEGIYFGGSSTSDYTQTDGQKGSYQDKHRVYGKAGAACVECATPIQRTKLVGRSTHFCPSCQTLEK